MTIASFWRESPAATVQHCIFQRDSSDEVVVNQNVFYSNQNIVTVGSHSGKVAAVNMYSGKEKFNIKLPDRIESSLYPSPCGKYGAVGNLFYNFILIY